MAWKTTQASKDFYNRDLDSDDMDCEDADNCECEVCMPYEEEED